MGKDIKQNPIQTSAEILKKCIYVICLMTSMQMNICESLKTRLCWTVFFLEVYCLSVSTVQIVLIYC